MTIELRGVDADEQETDRDAAKNEDIVVSVKEKAPQSWLDWMLGKVEDDPIVGPPSKDNVLFTVTIEKLDDNDLYETDL